MQIKTKQRREHRAHTFTSDQVISPEVRRRRRQPPAVGESGSLPTINAQIRNQVGEPNFQSETEVADDYFSGGVGRMSEGSAAKRPLQMAKMGDQAKSSLSLQRAVRRPFGVKSQVLSVRMSRQASYEARTSRSGRGNRARGMEEIPEANDDSKDVELPALRHNE